MLEVMNLGKVYRNGTVANDDISFCVEAGDVLGIIGANGAGKTTLVQQIAGLLRPTKGIVQIDGASSEANRRKYMSNIAFFSQNTYMLESHKAEEVIRFAGQYRDLSKKQAETETAYLMEYFGVDNIAGTMMSHLSGGQIKLIMLCSTFISQRPYIILDEPTNDLDPLNRQRLWDLIRSWNKEKHITFLIVSHNTTELETVAHTVAIINNAKLVEFGDIQAVKNKYGNQFKIVAKYEMVYHEKLMKWMEHQPAKQKYFGKFVGNNEIVFHTEGDTVKEVVQFILPMMNECNMELSVIKSTLAEVYSSISKEKV
jgi:ABC-2 type transport system ATP-binding protein